MPRPLLIAIHGAVANAAVWLPLQRVLGDACDVEAADVPGHGTRRDEPFAFERAVDEIVARALAERARRRIVVAGDSLGGYLALAAAARLDAAVAGVVAGSCSFPMRGAAAAAARLSLFGDALVRRLPYARITRRLCAPDVADAIVARGFAPPMRGVTLRALLGRDVLAEIRAISAPITFVDGAFDLPIAWCAPAMARIARSGHAVIVPNAGHGLGLTHPHAFAAAVRPYLSEAPPTKGSASAAGGRWRRVRAGA